MSELNALLTQKDDLLAQIRRIEESCEGIENESNARRISELSEQQMKLSTSKHDLQGKLSAIESELNGISSKIQELSGAGLDRILDAIKKQRWYFFYNKSHIMFDKVTGLLWPNLNFYNLGRGDIWGQCEGRLGYGANYDFLKSLEIDDIPDWVLPKYDDIKQTLNDASFPFYHSYSDNNRCVKTNYNSGQLYIFALKISDVINNKYCVAIDKNTSSFNRGNWDCGIMPKSHYLIEGSEYVNAVASSNNFYSEKEKLQFTLNIFVTNDLIPLFNDESITHLYRQIYVEKPALLQQLSELQSEINALQEVVLLSSTFDYHALLTGYDIPAINASVIKYQEAVTSLAGTFYGKVREYEEEKKATIREFDAAGFRLGAEYQAHPALSENENETLETGRSFLARHLSLNMDGVKEDIRSVKRQGESLAARIAAANRSKDSLGALVRIADEARADFALVAENLAAIVRGALKKIEFFEEHHDFAIHLIDLWSAWEENSVDFKTHQKDGFLAACEDHRLSAEWGAERYADWEAKRLEIARAFLPLAEFALQGHLLQRDDEGVTRAEKALALLQDYREDIDGFYREELWKLQEDFGSDGDYGRKEKLKTETAFYWRTAHWMKETWAEFLFSVQDSDERLFLARWLHPMLAVPAEALLDYTRTREELPMPAELISDLMKLQDQNVRGLLEDAEAYKEALNQRGHEFEDVIGRLGEAWKDAPAPGEAESTNTLGVAGEEGIVTISKA